MGETKNISMADMESMYEPWEGLFLVAEKHTPAGQLTIQYMNHARTAHACLVTAKLFYQWQLLEMGIPEDELGNWNA